MRVLFCTDGSRISYDALGNFAHWVPEDTTVDAICVIDWSFLPDEAVIEEAGFVDNCRNIADTILDYSQKEVTGAGLVFGEKIKVCGPAVESILEQLETGGYDCVITGSHGKKGIQMWLGSVSREVLESGKVPAYISKGQNEHRKILFTTDGSDVSLDAIKKSAELLNLADKEVYICTSIENPDILFLEGTLDANWVTAIKSRQEIYSAKALKATIDFLDNLGIEVKQSRVLEGTPAQSIINYAKEEKIDLTVLGSGVKTRMQKFLRGSVSKLVTENAKCDVFVVKV